MVSLCTDAGLQFQWRKQVLLWLIVASQLKYKVMEIKLTVDDEDEDEDEYFFPIYN